MERGCISCKFGDREFNNKHCRNCMEETYIYNKDFPDWQEMREPTAGEGIRNVFAGYVEIVGRIGNYILMHTHLHKD